MQRTPKCRGLTSAATTTKDMERISPPGRPLAYAGQRFVMRKVALVFLLAVFVPSLVLAWLAVRSLRDQHLVLERQQALLYQQVAEALAKDVVGEIEQQRREFANQVEALLATTKPRQLAPGIHETLRHTWPLTEVGFAVSLDGQVLAPSLSKDRIAARSVSRTTSSSRAARPRKFIGKG